MDSTAVDLIHASISKNEGLSIILSGWLFVPVLIIIGISCYWTFNKYWHHIKRLKVVNVDIQLGQIGKISLKPNLEDIQIAHRVWSELITRKAAIPIDDNYDLITEVYNSWYALFGEVRHLIGSIPGHVIRQEKSTREIVRITTDTLNNGLRPHLTKWQARFRNWYTQNEFQLKEISPQELQRKFPEYEELISEMKEVNILMVEYAAELRKIVIGL